jgi:hypothetical protein
MRSTALTLLAAAASVIALAAPASAAHGALTVTGLTANDRLVTFAASDPGTILSTVRITGLADGDDVAAIDFRPSTGGLYAVVTSEREGARLFLVDPATGAATRVGTASLAISGNVSIDFNPTVDLLRVVSDDGTNLRVSPVTGAVTTVDGPLSYATGEQPGIGDVAYTNNDGDAATGTMLFDVDAALDQLALQAPPNAGTLTRVGPLGQPTKAQATGFDVYTRTNGARTNWAFVSLFDKGRTTFYEIDVTTGLPITSAAPVPGSGQQIATRPHVTDIALAPAQTGF